MNNIRHPSIVSRNLQQLLILAYVNINIYYVFKYIVNTLCEPGVN